MNIVAPRRTPIIHAYRFCGAPTYSGTWFLTMRRPRINEGENFGLMKTRMSMSGRKMAMAYFRSRKLFVEMAAAMAMNIIRNSSPAAARISRSFRTGMPYPSTSSPNFTMLLTARPFLRKR